MRRGRPGRRARGVWLVVLLLLGAGCGEKEAPFVPEQTGPAPRPALPQAYRPSGHAAAGDVFVHLFEWKWPDIAAECETVLGPAGYRAVQLSPPQEHAVEPGRPWSQRYQPVSYGIDRSRSGTRAQFVEMVRRCRAAGVDIYVDAVINHMTNFPSPGVGSNGTAYSKYSYPGLYVESDFHPPCRVDNYASAANVQDCELLGLPDLNTGSASVRQKIAGYLLELARLGVAGFRIDAAKHIQPVELDEIVRIVNTTLAAESRPLPYLFAEVIDHNGNEAVTDRDYFGLGYASGGAADITEFVFKGAGNKFLNLNGERLFQLNPNGSQGNRFSPQAWGLIPSDKAVVFLENHDTQRDGGIGYRDGQLFRLANVWMLAQPYGYPSVLSGYAFLRASQRMLGPPSDAAGNTADVRCAARWEEAETGDWVCEHRDPYVARMVGFRRRVAGTEVTHWWDNGANAIAFSRGDRGFVAINREGTALSATVPTGLPPGTYCDLLTGGRAAGACAGTRVVVGADGSVQLRLEPRTALAVHVGTRL